MATRDQYPRFMRTIIEGTRKVVFEQGVIADQQCFIPNVRVELPFVRRAGNIQCAELLKIEVVLFWNLKEDDDPVPVVGQNILFACHHSPHQTTVEACSSRDAFAQRSSYWISDGSTDGNLFQTSWTIDFPGKGYVCMADHYLFSVDWRLLASEIDGEGYLGRCAVTTWYDDVVLSSSRYQDMIGMFE